MSYKCRLMGIDYGSKRVGIALSDDKGMMAFPKEVVPNDQQLLKKLEQIANESEVYAIVIGHSKNKDGEDNVIQQHIESFICDLTLALGLPVHLEPEYYSTQEAIRFQGRTDKTDAAAATVILNSFINRQKNTLD